MPQQQSSSSPSSRDRNEDLVSEGIATPPVLSSGVDDLLDEIDSLLEDNAEAFVKSFVQKGGQ